MTRHIQTAAWRLADLELWPVGALAALGAVSSRLLLPALILGALFWPVRWIARGRPTVRTPADGALVWLILMMPVTAWATALPDITRPQVYRLLAGLMLYYAIVNWTATPARRRLVALGAAAVGLLLALSAPVSVEWFAEVKLLFIPESLYRCLPLLVPDPIHPNVMAGVLAPLLAYTLGLLVFSWGALRRFERAVVLAAGLAMASVLVLTKSRGGLMGLAAAGLLLVALRWRRGWLALPAAALAGGAAVWQIGLARCLDVLTTTRSIGGIEGRLEIWSRALYMIGDFPFTGIGMGTFQPVANALYPFFLAGPEAEIPHAHNLFLQVAVDLGLPGLVAWLAVLVLVTLAAWQTYKRGRAAGDEWLAGLGAGLVCSQVALVVHGLTDAVTWGTRPAIVVWALWGLAMACRKDEQK